MILTHCLYYHKNKDKNDVHCLRKFQRMPTYKFILLPEINRKQLRNITKESENISNNVQGLKSIQKSRRLLMGNYNHSVQNLQLMSDARNSASYQIFLWLVKLLETEVGEGKPFSTTAYWRLGIHISAIRRAILHRSHACTHTYTHALELSHRNTTTQGHSRINQGTYASQCFLQRENERVL